MADSWSYKTDTGTVLPVSNSDLKAYVQSGQILPDTPLRKNNGPWTPASNIKGLTWFATQDFAVQPATVQPAAVQPAASGPSRHMESFFNPLTYDPDGATSAQRYPNLMKYIRVLENLISFVFRISLALIVIAFVVTVLWAMFNIGDLGLFQTLVFIVGAVVGAALYAMLAWLAFVSYMAILEFLRVVLDIENNTRG
jgi:hypothetical protein